MNRRQRACASGIDHAVGAAEVEAARDAPGRDVAEQAGKGVFLPADVGVGDALHHIVSDVLRDARVFEGFAPLWMAQSCAKRDHQFQCAGDAEDDAGAIAVEFARRAPGRAIAPGAGACPGCCCICLNLARHASRIASIGQRLLRGHHAEQLRSVGGLDVFRRHAEFHRVEMQR